MKNSRLKPPALALCILAAWLAWPAQAAPARSFHYLVAGQVTLRGGPGSGHKSLGSLDLNRGLILLSRHGQWSRVRAMSGAEGFVQAAFVSNLWIKAHKKERKLYLMQGDRVLKQYPIALCPFNPLGDKVRQGDGGTPEGRFYLCEMLARPGKAKYGARSMRLSYPNIEDARRGLAARLIDRATYLRIVKAIKAGRMPPQNTPLGGSLRIHGGGAKRDWTLGCLGMEDRDIIELFGRVGPRVRVEIYQSASREKELNAPFYLNRLILAGAKAQLEQGARYTHAAMAGGAISYPLGDIAPDQAVCTDIVIRALRRAGVDLQALVHEDAMLHPAPYRRTIKKPNSNIDHRRVTNLQIFFKRRAIAVPPAPKGKSYRPGDIVLMDTGVRNGTVFDHIGVVDDRKNGDGIPLAINIWTVGYRTSSMDLLSGSYPKVVGHYRLGHPFDYQD